MHPCKGKIPTSTAQNCWVSPRHGITSAFDVSCMVSSSHCSQQTSSPWKWLVQKCELHAGTLWAHQRLAVVFCQIIMLYIYTILFTIVLYCFNFRCICQHYLAFDRGTQSYFWEKESSGSLNRIHNEICGYQKNPGKLTAGTPKDQGLVQMMFLFSLGNF